MARSSIYNRLMGGAKKNINKSAHFINLLYEKRTFLILVFANLIAQLGITYYIMQKTNNPNINVWALFIAELVLVFIITLVPMPEFVKWLLFCLFSYIFGLMLSLLKQRYSPLMINIAIQSAMSVFGLMFAVGAALLMGGIQLGSTFGAILFWALLGLIIAELVFVIGAQMTQIQKFLYAFGIVLFAVYVLYDTNIILQRDYYGDFITASLDYYLDILNLFTNFLGYDN